jgi:two-component system sensor histidine kinase BaeS
MEEIDFYRTGVLFAACLTRRGVGVLALDGPYGVPRYVAAPVSGGMGEQARELLQEESELGQEECGQFANGGDRQRRADADSVALCTTGQADLVAPPTETSSPASDPAARPWVALPDGQVDLEACLSAVFASRIDEFAPVPLLVYLGAVDEDAAPPLSPAPVLAGAGLVALLAIAGSTLFSRRVLRPVQALTHASRRFGAGDLSERVPVVGHDELAGLATSFNRMADSLQRGEERQRRLVADVAHELRTPLANLRGYLEALKDGVVRPDADLFASLHEEAVLQQRIVDDLQDLALAEAGALLYHRSRTDLGELLETCRTAHQAVAEAADVRLTAISIGPAAYVYADPDRLRQVLGNLVSNALRATGAGGSVTLTARQDGPSVVVTVMDTGTGISPAQLPHVFDRFWRADAARGRATGGSGLGLAIARQIVTDHAGTIEVASTLGVGTTFTLRLPADDPAAPPWAA